LSGFTNKKTEKERERQTDRQSTPVSRQQCGWLLSYDFINSFPTQI